MTPLVSIPRRVLRFITGKLPRVAYPVLIGPLRGTQFILGSLAGTGGGATVYLNRIEPQQSALLNRLLKPGDIFFDIGANVGYYTILASKRVGDKGLVYAFEPLIRNIYYLYRHVDLNHADNVVIVSAACADFSGLTLFSFGKNTAEGHIEESTDVVDMSIENATPVPVITVDAVCALLNVQPDVIKIDVEGAELAVLQEAQSILSRAKPSIFLSVHSDELRRECLAFLYDLGYRVEPVALESNPNEFLAEYIAN